MKVPQLVLSLLLFNNALRADLVAYWPFDDATTLGDDSVSGTSLTANGNASHTTAGKFGGGLALDGAGDFLAGQVTNLPTGASSYTIAAWFKTTLGAGGLAGWGNYGTSRQVNALRLANNGFLNYWWGPDLFGDASPANILDNDWHHVAATYDGTTRSIYIDGVLAASDTPGALNATADNFRIGSTNFTEDFSGTLDEVYLYNEALTASEVMTLTSSLLVTTLADSGAGSLRNAIADSEVDGTILFAPSLSGQTITLASGQLLLNQTLTIDASSLDNGIIIDGDDLSRVLQVDNNDSDPVTLHNLTLTGGHSSGNGGAILVAADGTLLLSQCTLHDNRTADGQDGPPIISQGNGINGNDGGEGGAISASPDSTVTLVNCTINHNRTGSGGNGGQAFIAGVGGNGGNGGQGAGLSAAPGSILIVSHCTISDNQTGTGGDGGIAITGFGPGTQGAGGSGGGIAIQDAGFNLNNSTVTENQVAANGSGNGVFATSSAFVAIRQSIIAGNTGDNANDQVNGTIDNNPGDNLLLGSPFLAPLGDYGGPTQTMPPLFGSPALDTAGTTNPGGTDQRGQPRFVGNALDIGAVELQSPPHPTISSYDVNDDSLINLIDLAAITSAISLTPNSSIYDVNHDGVVSSDDAAAFISLLGPSTITVTNLNDSGSGSLRQALADADPFPGTRILFDPSLAKGVITLTSGQLAISSQKEVFIDASNLTGGLTIDANGKSTSHRVIVIQPNATAAFHGLTLTGGNADSSSGGSIHSNGSGSGNQVHLFLSHCTVTHNSAATSGAGIFNDATSGGHATLDLIACTISHNHSDFSGGGIESSAFLNGNVTMRLTACTIANNSARLAAGGIGNNGSNSGTAIMDLTDCTVSDNETLLGLGAGIHNNGLAGFASTSLLNCTLAGNRCASNGGGIHNDGNNSGTAFLNLDNCTLSGNSARFQGGGILSDARTDGSATIFLNNCILAGNRASDNADLREVDPGAVTTATGSNLLSDLTGYDSDLSANTTLTTDPLLTPLGYYGGLTKTMHPLANSPAILTGSNTSLKDQRGFSLTSPPTIGAVKIGSIVATKVSDEQSLRTALADSSNTQGRVIHFAPSLDGQTITLTSNTQLGVPGTAEGLFIDASDLPNGLTIDANQQSRVMAIEPNASVAIHGLTLTNGLATGGLPDGLGGGIYANGSGEGNSTQLALSSCRLTNNSALAGGAIACDSSSGGSGSSFLSVQNSTLSQNSADLGGAIFSGNITSGNNGSATLTLGHSTLSNNSSTDIGGGILSLESDVSLTTCTLSGNTAANKGGGISHLSNTGPTNLRLSGCTLSDNSANNGGGISHEPSQSTLRLHNTILAENNATNGPDLRELNGSISCVTGENILSSLQGQTSLTASSPGLKIEPTANLAPLGDYGGPTLTMPPLPGSSAINTATSSSRIADQRGLPVFGTPDIGAVELQSPLHPALANIAYDVNDDGLISVSDLAVTANAIDFDSNNLSYDFNSDQILSRDDIATVATFLGTALETITVTNLNDSGPGSLRSALSDANPTPGTLILFDSTLSGGTLSLAGNQLEITTGTEVFLDGNGLNDGLTIDAGGQSRVLQAQPNTTTSLHRLTLTGGRANGTTSPADCGGAIYADGSGNGNSLELFLSGCTLFGNSADKFGGAIHSNGTSSGSSSLTLNTSTLSGNSAATAGGAIYNDGFNGNATLHLTTATVSDNAVTTSNVGSGGGIFLNNTNSNLFLEDSILADNSATFGPDLLEVGGNTTTTGNNLISSLSDQLSLSASTPGLIVANPLLSPLANYGGPTPTMLPLPGSAAIDAATTSTVSADQRGFSRPLDGDDDSTALADLGAAEAPNWINPGPEDYQSIWLTDLDNDGTAFGVEFIIGSDPSTSDPAAPQKLCIATVSSAPSQIAEMVLGKTTNPIPNEATLTITRSTALLPGSFEEVARYEAASNTLSTPQSEDSFIFTNTFNLFFFSDHNPPQPKAFYRLESEFSP